MLNKGREDRLGVLFLGCGWATRIHSQILKRRPAVDLLYASRARARSVEACNRFGGRRAYGSYEDGLADETVDVALVATPTFTHAPLAALALRAGKHVIVEKPAFMSTSELDEVRDIARVEKRHLLVAENYYYKPIAERLRHAIHEGELGEVRFVSLNATRRRSVGDWRAEPTLAGGGALFEAGIHWINFASNIGLEVEGARAYPVGAADGTDRSSLVVFRYANGAIGTLAHSCEVGGLRLSKVQGTRGTITFESNGFAYVQTGRRRSAGFLGLSHPLGYHHMLNDFLDVLRNRRAPRFTIEMARQDLALLEGAPTFA